MQNWTRPLTSGLTLFPIIVSIRRSAFLVGCQAKEFYVSTVRWDPNREDRKWFDQSALLYCAYYHLQILIHRPFIPSPKKPSPLSFPSLAICTNAARSCSHVLDVQMRRTEVVMPWQCVSAFTSGIVLLLNIWGVKKSATSPDAAQQMQDVHKCMQHLKDIEVRCVLSTRFDG